MWLGPDLDPMAFVIVHIPWSISKGLDHPFACLCLLACFYALSSMIASLVLGFAMLDALSKLWLCGYI